MSIRARIANVRTQKRQHLTAWHSRVRRALHLR
jgi:hypothetical protein